MITNFRGWYLVHRWN